MNDRNQLTPEEQRTLEAYNPNPEDIYPSDAEQRELDADWRLTVQEDIAVNRFIEWCEIECIDTYIEGAAFSVPEYANDPEGYREHVATAKFMARLKLSLRRQI